MVVCLPHTEVWNQLPLILDELWHLMLNFSGSYWMFNSSAGRNVSSHTFLLPKPTGVPCQQFWCTLTAEPAPCPSCSHILMLSYMNFPFGMSCSSLDPTINGLYCPGREWLSMSLCLTFSIQRVLAITGSWKKSFYNILLLLTCKHVVSCLPVVPIKKQPLIKCLQVLRTSIKVSISFRKWKQQ